MLQLWNVSKSYTTGDFTQKALDEVSIAFRDNEFVAILGASGSGKTTMLNIIGGLDHYDSGDLVIDGVSTEDYRDRDWDTYRNNRIGFVFQSYNLIPHQTVLANVELALTLAGVSRSERRARAIEALDEVGLRDHIHKRPNQLSGGQMQRVAIARALVNDPEILLADEPTGALDSTTSLQIMALLTEIAADRLVVMVTHNPELAEQYATRVVHLSDGQVIDDTNPFDPDADDLVEEGNVRHTSMSFFTALALSFNNLMTKKGRTLMTAFAGSIGIMGIAAILALATGVNDYVQSIEEDTLSMYPLSIMSQGFDMTALMATSTDLGDSEEREDVPGEVHEVQAMNRMFSSIASNDLAALKKFLDADGGGIQAEVNSIDYSYAVTPQIFSSDTSAGVRQVNPDTTFASLGFGSAVSDNPLMAASMSTNVFNQLMGNKALIEPQYDVVAGKWPSDWDEVVVVLTPSGGISDFMLYAMGLRDPAELDAMVQQMVNEEPIVTPSGTRSYTYEEIMGVEFKLVNAADYYEYDPNFNVWADRSTDTAFLTALVNAGTDLRVVGIVQQNGSSTANALAPGIYYTPELTTHLINEAAQTEVVKAQLADRALNIFSGRTFADEAADPTGGEFDMSSLVTINTEAVQAAFSIDESALQLDLSGLNLDLSGISMPTMDLNMSNLQLDLSGVQIDPATLPQLDVAEILGQLDLAEADIDLELAQQVTAELVEAYNTFAETNELDPADVETNFPLFLATEEGMALAERAEGIVDLDVLSAQLQGIMDAYIQQAVGVLTAQLSQQIGTLLQTQIGPAIGSAIESQMGAMQAQIGAEIEAQLGAAMTQAMSQLAEQLPNAMRVDEQKFAEAFEFNMEPEELNELLMSMMSAGQSSVDNNLTRLGYADFDKPYMINIYPKDFESKGRVIAILDGYNERMMANGDEEQVITYTDLVGALMSSVTDIINVVSYVLVAFVSISLVVSSIMIGVITYISVLERKKEIGILRSIGASKRDIRRVFNAETLIVGFVAGLVGITGTILLTLPTNAIVESRFNIARVAQLPWQAAVVLVLISMGLTFLAGLIPSSAASRKDPVEALRSE